MYPTGNFWHEPIPCCQFIFGGPSWTLGVELSFYLIAPFLVRQRLSIQLLTLLASLAVRVALSHFFNYTDDPWNYRFFPSQVSFFMAGSLGYAFYHQHADYLKLFGAKRPWTSGFFGCAFSSMGEYPAISMFEVVFLFSWWPS